MTDNPDEPRPEAGHSITKAAAAPPQLPVETWIELKIQFKLLESATLSTVDLIKAVQQALGTENIQFSDMSVGNPSYGK